ncbi:MAG: signal peptidase I [Anaerolineales bacterium]|nr:signal peptidase I [Anaerolineales bacterium]
MARKSDKYKKKIGKEVDSLFDDLLEQHHETQSPGGGGLEKSRGNLPPAHSPGDTNGKPHGRLEASVKAALEDMPGLVEETLDDQDETNSVQHMVGDLPPLDPADNEVVELEAETKKTPQLPTEPLIMVAASEAAPGERVKKPKLELPPPPLVVETTSPEIIPDHVETALEVEPEFKKPQLIYVPLEDQAMDVYREKLRTDAESQTETPDSLRAVMIEVVQTLLLAVILFVGINLVSARILVDGDSMLPSFHNTDRVIVSRLAYKFGDFDYGDVIVFPYPYNPYEDYIKRVIGLPGDTVEVSKGKVYVNGHVLNEPYIDAPPVSEFPKTTVPEGSVFVMGDNRNNSSDSREWGALPEDSVIGKAVFIYWPLNRIGVVEHPEIFAPISP